tara:strand:- start:28861 stop:30381 length:1521 start_codon:yes stop_codon:yes gene_type:complete
MSFESTLTVSLNNQNYDISVILINGNSPAQRLPRGIVQEILIEDNIYSIFHTGKLTINSSHNALDNSPLTPTFNIDSRDTVLVDIKPVHKAGDERKFPIELWGLNFAFFIYDEEEVINGDTNNKTKIYHLRDIREQYLREINTRWSTAGAAGIMPNIGQLSDEHRSMYTGDAIQSLLTTGLEGKGAELMWADDWSLGSNKIFYTSTGDTTLFDDIEYVLDDHMSSDDDNCFLRAERSPNISLFSLRSVSDYFQGTVGDRGEGLGPANADVFALHSGTTTDTKGVNNSKIPKGKSPKQIDTGTLEMFDSLTNFELLNTSNADSMSELVTTLGHTYDRRNKEFIIRSKETHIQSIRDKYEQLVNDKLVSHTVNAVFPVNADKLENRVFKNIDTGVRSWYKKTIGRVMNKALAFSPGISFTVHGSTHRQAGRFYTLADKTSNNDTPFEKLLMGDWLGIKVSHVFMLEQNAYANHISCVRPFTYEPLLLDAPGTPGGLRIDMSGEETQLA